MGRKAQKNDSLPGSLDMLILRTLSLRDLHGYGIVQFIQQSSGNELLVEEGSLYPATPAAGAKRLDRRSVNQRNLRKNEFIFPPDQPG